MLGGNLKPKSKEEILKEWDKIYNEKKDAKNVSGLREIQTTINWLKIVKFDGIEEIRSRFEALLEERKVFVKARYEKEGWPFNF